MEFKSASASDVSHRYLWGPAVDQLFADEQPTSTGSAGNILWGLGDNLGTLRDIADLSGSTTSVTNHRRFGAYGDLVSESNSAVDMVFAFTGKLYDENTKLQNNLNRWYDAAIGQWMSEDPIGFAAGDENVKRYVRNATSTFVDPNGLQQTKYPFLDPFKEPEKDPANDPRPLTPPDDPDAKEPKISDVLKTILNSIDKEKLKDVVIEEATNQLPFDLPWRRSNTKPLLDLYGDDVHRGPLPRPRPRFPFLPHIEPKLPRFGHEPYEILKFRLEYKF